MSLTQTKRRFIGDPLRIAGKRLINLQRYTECNPGLMFFKIQVIGDVNVGAIQMVVLDRLPVSANVEIRLAPVVRPPLMVRSAR